MIEHDDPIGTRLRRSDEAHAVVEMVHRTELVLAQMYEAAIAAIRASDNRGALLWALGVHQACAEVAHEALDRLEGVER